MDESFRDPYIASACPHIAGRPTFSRRTGATRGQANRDARRALPVVDALLQHPLPQPVRLLPSGKAGMKPAAGTSGRPPPVHGKTPHARMRGLPVVRP